MPPVGGDMLRESVESPDIVEVGVRHILAGPACVSKYIMLHFCEMVCYY